MVNIEHTLCVVSMIFALGVSNHADATFSYSDVAIHNGSVTFESDGDMTGYVAGLEPLFDNDQLSVRSKGDIWNGVLTYSPNVSSTSVFDAATITDPGNTGTFGTDMPYTWSHYIYSLASATAFHRMATVTFGDYYRDPYGSRILDFLLGNGNVYFEPVLLVSAVVDPVPVLETYMLLLAGIGLAGFVVRRRHRAPAHH